LDSCGTEGHRHIDAIVDEEFRSMIVTDSQELLTDLVHLAWGHIFLTELDCHPWSARGCDLSDNFFQGPLDEFSICNGIKVEHWCPHPALKFHRSSGQTVK
jgi:hypothetical protein